MTDSFSTRLRELREKAELTQEGLARLANLSTATIVKLERESKEQDPSWSTVQALADALGVSTEAFRVQATPPAEPAKKSKARK
ncbi:MAG: helix-turn-helix transcriptional regulator [Gemmataceae bacterium]